jgi:hypothetical protein
LRVYRERVILERAKGQGEEVKRQLREKEEKLRERLRSKKREEWRKEAQKRV